MVGSIKFKEPPFMVLSGLQVGRGNKVISKNAMERLYDYLYNPENKIPYETRFFGKLFLPMVEDTTWTISFYKSFEKLYKVLTHIGTTPMVTIQQLSLIFSKVNGDLSDSFFYEMYRLTREIHNDIDQVFAILRCVFIIKYVQGKEIFSITQKLFDYGYKILPLYLSRLTSSLWYQMIEMDIALRVVKPLISLIKDTRSGYLSSLIDYPLGW